jgi:hydroxypyruvate reductase
MTSADPLLTVARAAIASVHGEALCRAAAASLDRRQLRVHLLGAGKAALAMARGVVAGLPAPVASGLCVTSDEGLGGFAPPGVEVCVGDHPIPGERSAHSGARVIRWLGRRGIDELVVAVLSGGASALLAAPAPGLAVAELAATTRALLAAALPIEAVNLVRKQITCASGGRLTKACAARVEVLVMCDVVSGDADLVASGPFAPDGGTAADALAILRPLAGVPARVLDWLAHQPPSARAVAPGEPCFTRVRQRVVASHDDLLRGAEAAARALFAGVTPVRPMTGTVAAAAAGWREVASGLAPGVVAVGGGEPVVALPPGAGRGGRCQDLALRVAQAIAGMPVRFLAIASDGRDGPTDAAGAVVDGDSWARLAAIADPAAALARADAYPVLDAAGMLVRTGGTGTNVCDLHLMSHS